MATPTATTPSCGPGLMRETIKAIQDGGVEVDLWKIEGVDEREDANMLAELTRTGEGREGVVCVLLGPWRLDREGRALALPWRLRSEGFIGFAIGRSIWWDALKAWLAEDISREAAASQIADNYLHFVRVYEGQVLHWGRPSAGL